MAESNSTVTQVDNKAYLDAMAERVNATSYGSSACNDLSVLFDVIRKLADEHSQIAGLAGIGRYLADDWGNCLDCQREEAKAALNAATEGVRVSSLNRS